MKKSHLGYWLVVLLILISIYQFATGFMAFAALTYFILLFGLIIKKNKYLHVRLMSTAIIFDLSLVLLLELQRHAIETTLQNELSNLQRAHIYCSTLAVLCYIPTLILGLRLYKNKPSSRKWHLRFGGFAFLFRTIGFIMMFSLIEFVKH